MSSEIMEKVKLNLKEIGERLKKARKALDKTQNELSKLSGVAHSVISEMENGLRKPYPQYLMLLSELKINLNWIFNGRGSMFADSDINWKFAEDNKIIKELIYLMENVPVLRYALLKEFMELRSKYQIETDNLLSKKKSEG